MAKTDSSTSNKVVASNLDKVLGEQVANLNVLYVKLHHYHWYVKGENFYTYMLNLKNYTTRLH